MAQFLQTNGDYTIRTSEGGTITFDTGPRIGQVNVTGNLVVEGDTLTVSAENLDVQDNIIRLNVGETGPGVSLRYSGLEIDRGTQDPASFYFDENDVTVSGQYNVEYHGPPLGVIPLDKVEVSIPPGGRRVFREHAQTNARTGYEIAILHKGAAGGGDGARPPAFVVTQSLQLRDKWAHAIKARAKVDSHTKLRAVLAYQSDPSVFASRPQDLLKKNRQNQRGGKDKRSTRKGKRPGAQAETNEPGSNEALVKEALQDFGKNGFQEKQFLDNFFLNVFWNTTQIN